VIATAKRFLTQGLAILAIKIPSGIANKMQTNVTASAIASVLMAVEKYAGTVKMFMKLSRMKPGITFEVNGSMNHSAVTSRSASEIM
jgi:hypothetical protein